MNPRAMTREEEFLENKDFFRRNAFLVIKKIVGMAPEQPSMLVDEILHIIFFLGEINRPKYSPQDIVIEQDLMNILKGRYPKPFKCYPTQIPRRSPISCVLDMTVYLTGQEKESEIIADLQKLIHDLRKDQATDLVCSTICVSQLNQSERHYGVSFSTAGRDPGRIVTGADCLSGWELYVAGAVMTYYPKKEKKAYFDGTIKIPGDVRCQAFNLSDGNPMAACRSCANLFGLTTSEKKEWPYGNCAEVESLSNLLKKEKELEEKVRPTSETYTDENRKKAADSAMKEVTDSLRMLHFKWDKNFYTPEGHVP
ncbi:uncharacterized protein [Brachionichthys hirsutus]|uniref:uncharacterized protein n=1 Tax=Brachionichthys hirsutus TaxID=412623 RepID=UPI003604948B